MTAQRIAGASVDMTPVLRRLQAQGPVSAELGRLIEGSGRRVETVASRTVLQTEGEPAPRSRFILSGWAFRQRLLPDGRRQILSILLPGDALGVCLRHGPLVKASTVALTRMNLVDATDLLLPSTLAEHADLTDCLDRAVAYEESLLLDHVVRLGRQTAYERVAHMLLELHHRMTIVGLSQGGSYDAPLTQEVMADALGLSVVHTNRTLQQLRRERMIVFEGGKVTLLAIELLAAAADYAKSANLKAFS